MATNPLAFAPSHPDTKTPGAPTSVGLYGDALRRYIIQRSQQLGLDPYAPLAVVPHEGGFAGVTGDQGTSFGPFQLHVGGALPQAHVSDARQFANSPAGVDYALQQIKAAVGDRRGPAAVQAIVTGFEKPAAQYVPREIAAATQTYRQVANGPPSAPQTAGTDPFVTAFRAAVSGKQAVPSPTPPGGPAVGGDPFVAAFARAASGATPPAPAPTPTPTRPARPTRPTGDPFVSAFRAATGLTTPDASQSAFAAGGLTTPAAPATFKPLNGAVPMVTGGRSPYKNLTFAGHTDWQHVNPTLLSRISQALAQRGLTGQVISGYRSNDYSAANGGFRGDPHTKGVAVDVYVNGQPIGKVIPATAWQKLGIRSGDTFTYHGAPDYEHLDLIGYGY